MTGEPRRGCGPAPLRSLLPVLVLALSGCTEADRAPARESAQGSPSATPAQVAAERVYDGLDPADVAVAEAAVQDALESKPSKQSRYWSGAQDGSHGFVTPLRTFRITTGHYCREYLVTVTAGTRVVSATKMACRDDDAIWKEATLSQ